VRLVIDEDAVFSGFERWDIPPHGEPVPVDREDGPEVHLSSMPVG
jgi:hypothetical protein